MLARGLLGVCHHNGCETAGCVRCAAGFLCGGVLRGASAVNPPVIALADYKNIVGIIINSGSPRTYSYMHCSGWDEGRGGGGGGRHGEARGEFHGSRGWILTRISMEWRCDSRNALFIESENLRLSARSTPPLVAQHAAHGQLLVATRSRHSRKTKCGVCCKRAHR